MTKQELKNLCDALADSIIRFIPVSISIETCDSLADYISQWMEDRPEIQAILEKDEVKDAESEIKQFFHQHRFREEKKRIVASLVYENQIVAQDIEMTLCRQDQLGLRSWNGYMDVVEDIPFPERGCQQIKTKDGLLRKIIITMKKKDASNGVWHIEFGGSDDPHWEMLEDEKKA